MADESTQAAAHATAAGRRLAALISGYQTSAALGALARLGVADVLAEGPRSAGELAQRLGADERALARVLNATVDADIVVRGDDGRYQLGELGELLRSAVPGSMRRFASVSTEPWRWAAYGHLSHTVRTGEPGFIAAHGCHLWDYLAAHPDAAASFEESMARVGLARDQAVARAVDLAAVARLVDVGGGRGGLMVALLAANPTLRGVVFDLAAVVEGAREQLRRAGVAERCEAVAGDIRESVPPGADAYVLSWILHDWDDATALRILGNCRAAMAEGARLFIVEMVVPEADQPGAAAFARLVREADLDMLAMTGGRERTAGEYEQVLTGSGFVLNRIVPLQGLPWGVIEASAV